MHSVKLLACKEAFRRPTSPTMPIRPFLFGIWEIKFTSVANIEFSYRVATGTGPNRGIGIRTLLCAMWNRTIANARYVNDCARGRVFLSVYCIHSCPFPVRRARIGTTSHRFWVLVVPSPFAQPPVLRFGEQWLTKLAVLNVIMFVSAGARTARRVTL